MPAVREHSLRPPERFQSPSRLVITRFCAVFRPPEGPCIPDIMRVRPRRRSRVSFAWFEQPYRHAVAFS
ncbi:hypothetical protein NDU88_000399 [Pleurodeles waltl]|uniref:Uncharacterized protein n=1 Tax=Pleurodeles waltl TaxID=8319 RepID=A0AAV7WLA1_PLEWA|nr:hypothetical protein NDU88_000399 [Pleurodeles waltl]